MHYTSRALRLPERGVRPASRQGRNSSDMETIRQRVAAELIGTFILVFAGTGAIVVDASMDGVIGHVGIALTFGLVVMAMIYSVGEVSGAHINPAVTVAFFAAGRLPLRDALPYIVAQCGGAILASGLLRFLFPLDTTLGATLPAGSHAQTFVFEVMLTLILMFVIFSVASGSKERGLMAGTAIGGVVALEALFAGPITGASMNPARSLGPALVAGQLDTLWIYLSAPVLGALLAVPLCHMIHREECCGTAEDRAAAR